MALAGGTAKLHIVLTSKAILMSKLIIQQIGLSYYTGFHESMNLRKCSNIGHVDNH